MNENGLNQQFKSKKTLKAFKELVKKYNLYEAKISELSECDLAILQVIKRHSENI